LPFSGFAHEVRKLAGANKKALRRFFEREWGGSEAVGIKGSYAPDVCDYP
jgi:hypothetical protein